jgi:hypothetical protein
MNKSGENMAELNPRNPKSTHHWVWLKWQDHMPVKADYSEKVERDNFDIFFSKFNSDKAFQELIWLPRVKDGTWVWSDVLQFGTFT